MPLSLHPQNGVFAEPHEPPDTGTRGSAPGTHPLSGDTRHSKDEQRLTSFVCRLTADFEFIPVAPQSPATASLCVRTGPRAEARRPSP